MSMNPFATPTIQDRAADLVRDVTDLLAVLQKIDSSLTGDETTLEPQHAKPPVSASVRDLEIQVERARKAADGIKSKLGVL